MKEVQEETKNGGGNLFLFTMKADVFSTQEVLSLLHKAHTFQMINKEAIYSVGLMRTP